MRLGFFWLTAVVCAAAPATADMRITTEEYPPFNLTDNGRVTGISTEIVRKIFDMTHIPYHIEMLPWQRAYTTAIEEKDTCVYSKR
jgi:polar amino acid transport system substrate-binding protein